MVCNSNLSEKITKNKIANIEKTSVKSVVTDCSGCKIGLIKGLITNHLDLQVIQPIELFAKLHIKPEKKI